MSKFEFKKCPCSISLLLRNFSFVDFINYPRHRSLSLKCYCRVLRNHCTSNCINSLVKMSNLVVQTRMGLGGSLFCDCQLFSMLS